MCGYYWQMAPCGYSSYTGEVEDYRLWIPEPKSDDAGITEITPAAPCAGNNSVMGRIMNFGKDTLKSITVTGTVKEIGGATTTFGPTTLTGLSLARLQDSLYTLGTYNFQLGKKYDVEIWTSSPNGKTDSNTTNDKLTKLNFGPALGGTYTIGSSSTADFATISDAEAALRADGVCSAVIFNMEDGTYNEQVIFKKYVGISATNNVRFRPHPNNTGRVVWEYSSTSSSNRGTAIFDGAEYITIDSITIKAKGSSYANVLQMDNSPKHLSFNHDSLIVESTSTSTSNWLAVVYNYQTGGEYVTLRDNVLWGGSSGIYCYGGSSSNRLQGGWTVERNKILHYNWAGIYSYYVDNNEFNWNEVVNRGSYGYPYGIYMYYNYGTNVNYNNIQITASNRAYALYASYCRGTSTNRKSISNNMAAVKGGSGRYHYSGYFRYCDYNDIDHNSLSIEQGDAYGVYLYFGNGVNFRNNVCATWGTYYSYYQRGSQTMSNNAWWAPNATRTLGNLGSNAINVDPKFTSVLDLHSKSISLHDSGMVLTSITQDIDMDVRCPGTGCPGGASKPDIGADEFWLADYDISPVALGVNPCAGSQPVQIKVENVGVKALTSFTVNWSINGVAQTALTVSTSNVAPGGDTLVTVGNHTFVNGVSYNFEYITSSPSGQTDQQMFNDTLRETLTNALSGTYAIGTGGDFPGIDTAVKTITSLGLCGPVTLQLMDSTFKETVLFDKIPGNSATNTITIVQHPMNTGTAIVEGSFQLGEVSHLTVRGIQFDHTANVFDVQSGGFVQNLVVDSCEFNLGATSGALYYDGHYANNSDSVWITNNVVNNGYYGVRFYGGSSSNSSSKESNIWIENNEFNDFYYYGVYCFYTRNIHINNNKVMNPTSTSRSYWSYGVYTYYSDGVEIMRNNIFAMGTGGGYGYYSYSCGRYGTSSDSIIVINNFITAGNTTNNSTRYGVYYGWYDYRIKFYHNNVSVIGTSSGTNRTIYTRYMRTADFKNNIFENQLGGNTWYNQSSSGLTNNYNAFWTGSSTNNGTQGFTMGSNSMTTNPRYKDVTMGDLRVNSIQLDSAATNVGVAIDHFGNPRNLGNHDIGAHEFDPCYWDAVAREFSTPHTQVPTGQSVRMRGRVSNIGLDSITNVVANGSVGTSTANMALGTILSDGDSSYNSVVSLIGVTPGQLNAEMYTTLTQTDCDNANDTTRYAFEVSDSVYAFDDSTYDNRLGFNPPFTGEFGNVFEIFNTDTITSGSFFLNGPVQGATVRLLIYAEDTSTIWRKVDSTRAFIVGASGTGWYTLNFGCAGVVATPGRYLITIEQSNPVRMELAINTTMAQGVAGTRYERGTGGTWNDLFNSSSSVVANSTLLLRANLGEVSENDVLPDTSLICNNSDTYIKTNKKYTTQLWSNGLFFDSIKVTSPGAYAVRVVDQIGCVYMDTTNAVMATPMSVTTAPTAASCGMSDGSVSVTLSGAYAPHTYKWSTGDTTMNLGNVPGDDYEVTITDAIGCKNTQKVTVLGAYPQVASMWTYPTCNGDQDGSAMASIVKGVSPYNYAWSAGGTPNQAQNSQLSAGTYIVTVTDASGCQTLDTVEVKDPAVLAVNEVVAAPSACKMADGSVIARTNGGLAPYKYLWSNGQTSRKAVGLTEGIYDVTITDSLGCAVIGKATVSDPNSPVSVPNNLRLDCSYDTTTVRVAVQGGTSPFTYNWDYKNMKTSTINGVGAGTYKLHLVDAAGCDHDTTVTITAPTKVNVNFVNIVDNGQNAVEATANTSGGTPPYTWKWTPSGETDSTATKLQNGVNKVTVVDSKGCSFVYQIDVYSEFTGVGILNNPAVYNIYPNPTTGLVNIDLNLNSEEDVRVRVMNALGEVLEVIERDNVVQDQVEVNLTGYATGVYFIETTAGAEKVVSRIQLAR
jgi:hypothetical protein